MGLQERLGNKEISLQHNIHGHRQVLEHVFGMFGESLKDKVTIPEQDMIYATGQYHYAFGGVFVDEGLLQGTVVSIEDLKHYPCTEKTKGFLKIPKPHEPWRDWSRQVEYILQKQYAYLGEWMLPTGIITLPEDEYMILQKSAEGARPLTVGELLQDDHLVMELERFLLANEQLMKTCGMGYDIIGAKAFGSWVSVQLQAFERAYLHLLGPHVDVYEMTWKSCAKPLLRFIRKKFAEVWDFVYDDGSETPRLDNILILEEAGENGVRKKRLVIQDISLMYGVVPGVNDHLPTMWSHAWNHPLTQTRPSHLKAFRKWFAKAREEWSKREIVARMCAHYQQATTRALVSHLKTPAGREQVAKTIERSKEGWQ